MIEVSAIASGWPTIEDLEAIVEEEVRELAGNIFRYAVRLSPVYTGAYRASWRVSFNVARTDVTEGHTPQAPIRGAAFRWPAGYKPGYDVIISNNQPYAERIEMGWSKQAPLGVLRIAVEMAVQ